MESINVAKRVITVTLVGADGGCAAKCSKAATVGANMSLSHKQSGVKRN